MSLLLLLQPQSRRPQHGNLSLLLRGWGSPPAASLTKDGPFEAPAVAAAISADLGIILSPLTLSSAGVLAITGSLVATLAPVTLSSTSALVTTTTLRGRRRRRWLESIATEGAVASSVPANLLPDGGSDAHLALSIWRVRLVEARAKLEAERRSAKRNEQIEALRREIAAIRKGIAALEREVDDEETLIFLGMF